jgi:heme a synthase
VGELLGTIPFDDIGRRRRFVRWTWIPVALNVFVIVWGAWVRATGSGAVVPPSPEAATVIGYVHRVISGLALTTVLGLLIAAWRVYPRNHLVRRNMTAASMFILLEAGIGAGLVVFRLVAGDTATARAVVGALHLANTDLLLAALALSAVRGEAAVSPRWQGGRGEVSLLPISLGLLLLVGMAGTVTALGATVFRPGSLAAGIMQELAPAAPLVRMRLVHPGVAALASLLTGYWASTMSMRAMSPLRTAARNSSGRCSSLSRSQAQPRSCSRRRWACR